jgi:hypothetical protein
MVHVLMRSTLYEPPSSERVQPLDIDPMPLHLPLLHLADDRLHVMCILVDVSLHGLVGVGLGRFGAGGEEVGDAETAGLGDKLGLPGEGVERGVPAAGNGVHEGDEGVGDGAFRQTEVLGKEEERRGNREWREGASGDRAVSGGSLMTLRQRRRPS